MAKLLGRIAAGGGVSYHLRAHVRGASACFARPDLTSERVSYPVITPSAARSLLEAVHWNPAIRWVVDRIILCKPIRFDRVSQDEIGGRSSAQVIRFSRDDRGDVDLQVEEGPRRRSSLLLRDVDYLIDAHLELTETAVAGESVAAHCETASQKLRQGRFGHQPLLGSREFPAEISLWEGEAPTACGELQGEQDLGWILHDVEFVGFCRSRFFHAVMKDGVIEVPPLAETALQPG